MRTLFLILCLTIVSEAHARRRVMLTAFEPFGGRPDNGSKIVAEKLASEHNDADVEYVTCVIPVEYDKAAARAKECYDQMTPKPDVVISTGEGGCDIRVETKAMNYDDTPRFADNAGVERVEAPININTTPYEFLTLPVQDMVCAVDDVQVGPPVNTSTWAGYYVCNNTAYHMSRYLKPQGVPFGFIHLPVPSSCEKYSADDTATVLNKMIRAGVRSMELRAGTDGKLACEIPNFSYPQGTQDLMNIARAACENIIRSQVRDFYSPPTYGNRRGDI